MYVWSIVKRSQFSIIRSNSNSRTGKSLEMEQQDLLHADTPCLVLAVDKVDRNVVRMRHILAGKNVGYRPHLKTSKSIKVAEKVMSSPTGPATVSTLREAELFAAAGVQDILYAVGIAAHKLRRVSALHKAGVNLAVLLDSIEQAQAVAEESKRAGVVIPAFIEIDCDGHRSGIRADDVETLTSIARAIEDGGELRGVLTHAGLSYNSSDKSIIEMWALDERDAAVTAAETLRSAGFRVPIVSVGSTPTALAAIDLTGVTEVRAGVFMFFDLFQTGVGTCLLSDIALSVLATVIGYQQETGRLIIDAGWMALSRDRGTASQPVDQKYGMVCDINGIPYEDLLVLDANQEHGIAGLRPGSGASMPNLPRGSKVRILPNHACATAAQHEGYLVVEEGTSVKEYWPRFNGW
jgi:D-serine deaminase-like pyridoxal phosphate-dependent protein